MPEILRAPTRPYHSAIMDSRRWDGFKPRQGDIVIATFAKCGTTWMQRIVDLLIFRSAEARPITQTAPWLDATVFAPVEEHLAALEAQTHRRFVKSHLPFDSVPIWRELSYIHVVRDGRDSCLSMHNHRLGYRPEMGERFARAAREALGGATPAPPPFTPADPGAFFRTWIETAERYDERTDADLPYFQFENTYWSERRRANLLFVHYNDLKADLAGEMRRIADFLDIDIPPHALPELVRAATFDSMKRDGEVLLPTASTIWDKGADRFLNKGTNGRWRDILTAGDIARYEALAARSWTPVQAKWIEQGRLAVGDPRQLDD